ncbi:MAG: F0F1 ATP synthase subunit A [Chloroherpetonaceae bacterium]|nr:F0F1 ATP synthase subunit A [Chloroherpetonaceae bacterium]MCS7211896.1 F0F1 ATP synthase subunit A [Chloroherpetonaceae bacterium]MDW8019665.1 F0F1 ATP synthase subunit A [Chloroherpetonaceae bacterium]MDW8465262.1 F0F1 ATP synthase subunit A [Chloroherpetonaceae bacterium]
MLGLKASFLALSLAAIVSLPALASDSKHDEGDSQKLDVMHHILDARTLDFEPFGEIHLPQFPPIQIGSFTIDISPTRHVVMMWIASALLLALMIRVGNRYKAMTSPAAPSGLANVVEAVVQFIRDDIARPNIGEHYQRFLPYLLTVFFFILFCNLLGLVPFAATATGNIAVTMTLATFTFVLTQYAGIRENGIRGWLAHLTGGAPPVLWIIMIPVEIVSLFVKPFALTMRLFANMTAGHTVIIVLISLIFIFKSFLVAPVSIALTLAIYGLELFVAFMQAYIFTMLSSVFIGLAMAHGHEEGAH